ncbi:MAG: hypothetical protein WC479_02955 [Candidatus Izemoplasmatales bacterium]
MIETELCKLALKYGADKCPQIGHMYTPFYYEYLKDRKYTIKKVLEVGIGNKRQIKYIPGAFIGASIRMWRDFFPNAMVYGADVAKESFFKDERIETYYCDENKEEDIKKLVSNIGTDIDLVIDDACHHIASQLFLFKTLMPLLDKGVTYVIEDCRRTRQVRKTFPEYESFIPQLLPNGDPNAHDGLVILKK